MNTPKLLALSTLTAAAISVTTMAPAQQNAQLENGHRLLVSQADQSERKMGRHHGKQHRKGKRAGHGMKRMLRGLDLTEAQRDEIFQLRHTNAPLVRETRKKMNAARKELKALAISGQFDPARADQLSAELGQAAAQASRTRTEMFSKVYQILTPEQRAKLKKRMEQRQGKRGRA